MTTRPGMAPSVPKWFALGEDEVLKSVGTGLDGLNATDATDVLAHDSFATIAAAATSSFRGDPVAFPHMERSVRVDPVMYRHLRHVHLGPAAGREHRGITHHRGQHSGGDGDILSFLRALPEYNLSVTQGSAWNATSAYRHCDSHRATVPFHLRPLYGSLLRHPAPEHRPGTPGHPSKPENERKA